MALVAVATIVALVTTSLSAHASIADKRNDYNGDGISDLVAISLNTGCLVRWLGQASGEFGTGVVLGCRWMPYAANLAAPGDLNRDGVGDIVAVNQSTGCLVRWFGDGRGGFGTGVELGCGWEPYYSFLGGAGDLNNDGNGDLVAVHDESGCLVRWFGDGRGGFGTGVQLGCDGWTNYAGHLTGAGDLNNDGNADLVAVHRTTECLVRWLGDGRGGLGAGVQLSCGWGPSNFGGAVSGLGALNGNNHGDLVAINTDTDCLERRFGNGRGGYGAKTELGCGWDRYSLAA